MLYARNNPNNPSYKMSLKAHFRHAAMGSIRASADSKNTKAAAFRTQNEIQFKRVHNGQAIMPCSKERTGYFDLCNIIMHFPFTLQSNYFQNGYYSMNGTSTVTCNLFFCKQKDLQHSNSQKSCLHTGFDSHFSKCILYSSVTLKHTTYNFRIIFFYIGRFSILLQLLLFFFHLKIKNESKSLQSFIRIP